MADLSLAQSQRAAEALSIVHEISTILDTGLDRETLSILIALIETGVNPEALAAVVRELRREAAALKATHTSAQPSTGRA
jgi:mitotic-spindle organizing protein 1